jgi:hypothetical protein
MHTPVWQDAGAPIEVRQALYDLNVDRLRALAHNALEKGLGPHDIVVVCIHVDDPAWRELVDFLMPDEGENWAAMRRAGQTPIARGTTRAEFMVDLLAGMVPDLAPQLIAGPALGCVHAAVMAQGGASLYEIPIGPRRA